MSLTQFHAHTLRYFGKEIPVFHCSQIVQDIINLKLGKDRNLFLISGDFKETFAQNKTFYTLDFFIEHDDFYIPLRLKVNKNTLKNDDKTIVEVITSFNVNNTLEGITLNIGTIHNLFVSPLLINEYINFLFNALGEQERKKYEDANKYLIFFHSNETLGQFKYSYDHYFEYSKYSIIHYNRDKTKIERNTLTIEWDIDHISFNELMLFGREYLISAPLNKTLAILFSKIADTTPDFMMDVYSVSVITNPYQYCELIAEVEDIIKIYNI